MKLELSTAAKICLGVVAFSLPILMAAQSNAAQPTCGTREAIVSTLSKQYKGRSTHRGLTRKGTMVEIFASKAKTFTVVITGPKGLSCLVTAGTQWHGVGERAKPKPEEKVF